ncbi:MAG: STAS domain-containing protein [Bacteroidia bacterium]|nr:STAS domain-containing protein [Bacteroidia bacterium]
MQIIENEDDNYYIIKIFGDVDAASSITLDKAIEEAVEKKQQKILIDCGHLNYISSAGLGVFMSYIEDFKEKGTYFALYGLNEKVKNVFEILGLDKLLLIFDSKEEAKQ